jgi:cytoskeletal protein RodZ
MESVGQKLRAIRLQQGFSLEDISAKTRISKKNLQAIENDDLSLIGSSFFYKSFTRQFAQQLKFDYQEIAPAVEELAHTLPEPLMPGQTGCGVTLPSVPALRSSRPKLLRWLYSFSSLVVMIMACSGLYSAWQNSRSQLQANLSAFVHSLMDRSAQERNAKATAVPERPETPAEPAAGPAISDASFRVELSAIERTWLSIVADGHETFTGILEATDTKVLEGHDIARVRTGNAGGLSVVYNGKAIGSLGPRGQVRTVVFTRTGYEMSDASAAPVAQLVLSPFIPNGE